MTSTETPANNRKRDLSLTSPVDSEESTWKKQQDKRSNNSKKIKTNEDTNKNIEDLRNNSKTHVVEPTKKTSAPSKSIIKLIIQKHKFGDEKINKNYFNQNICTNFSCISVKKCCYRGTTKVHFFFFDGQSLAKIRFFLGRWKICDVTTLSCSL